jgi:hypothetical protein
MPFNQSRLHNLTMQLFKEQSDVFFPIMPSDRGEALFPELPAEPTTILAKGQPLKSPSKSTHLGWS